MRLIKTFAFGQRGIRSELVFSDSTKIRLDDDNRLDPALTLRLLSGGSYSTDSDLTVTLWTINPRRVRRWLAFEAETDEPAGTSVRFRLVVLGGTEERVWDGADWSAPASASDWTSAADMQAHLSAYTLEATDIALKIRLTSTGAETPRVKCVKLLAELDLDSWDDLIYDTVIASLQSSLRAVTILEFAAASETDTFPLVLENSGFNFTGIRAAYNLTQDPNAFRSIAQSYVPGAARRDGTFEDGTVTLTETIPEGETLRLELEYVPEIAVITNQDYYEPARFPAVVIEEVLALRQQDRSGQELNDGPGDVIRDIAAGTGVKVPRPRQTGVRFGFSLMATGFDIARLVDAMDRWMAANRLLHTFAFDIRLPLDPVQEIQFNERKSNLDDITAATGAFRLRGVPFYVRDAEDVPLVANLNINASVL